MGDRLSGTELVAALAWAVCFLGTVMGALFFLAWLEQPPAERWVPGWWSRTRPEDTPRVDAARVPELTHVTAPEGGARRGFAGMAQRAPGRSSQPQVGRPLPDLSPRATGTTKTPLA